MPLKFAFLGVWHSHAGMHVREAAQRPAEFQLVGMYDPDADVIQKRKAWTQFLPDIPVFPSLNAVLDSDAEAVVVEGRVYQNLDYAQQALEAGKHVLLEKPAGVDLIHLEHVQEIAARKGLMLQMAYMWRYNPAIHEIIRLVKSGALGDIFYYRGHIPKPKTWHPELESEFGMYHAAVYFEMAGHLVDLMVAVMGKPKHVHPVLGKHYGDNLSHVDNAVVVHEFESGLGTIDTAAMHIGMDRTRRIEVYGTEGTAIHTQIGSANLSLCLETPFEDYQTGWQQVVIDPPQEFPSPLRELSASIRGLKQPDYTLAHDLTVQRVLLDGCGIKDGKALK